MQKKYLAAADTQAEFVAMSRDAVSVSGACRFVFVVSTPRDDGGRKSVSGDEVEPKALNLLKVHAQRLRMACVNL
ncbi:MAG: hypothetical protein JNL58_30860 [Planctomyces sp.]|nr:hypothetical protein [Planctomyces sp.]